MTPANVPPEPPADLPPEPPTDLPPEPPTDLPPEPLEARLARLERRELPGGLTLLVAADRRARGRGLGRLDALPAGHALLLERCRSVHTLGMRFALDLLWLDEAGALVRLDRAVAPRRLRTCLRARAVVEAPAGEGERFLRALEAPT